MKVAYWSTSSLEPRYEAVSQEVFGLAKSFPGSWIFAVSPHYIARFSRKGRYAGLHTSMNVVLRAVIPILERAFDVSHIYGNMTPWIFHRSLGSRPVVHTVTQDSPEPVTELLERCTAIVVQSEDTRDRVLALGIEPARVHLRRSGIDLTRFKAASTTASKARPPGPRVRVLFSTAPRAADELEARGVFLLLEAARRSPETEFRFLYRTWSTGYTSLEATRKAIEARGVTNVELTDGVADDMPRVYAGYDFTVVPFTRRDGGKECPNSAVESLACGVPVLVSRACPFARFVEENRCGITFDPTPEAFLEAVEKGWKAWPELAAAARDAAEAHFDSRKLLEFYQGLYQEAACAPASIRSKAQKSPA